jgi:hypothetical protein
MSGEPATKPPNDIACGTQIADVDIKPAEPVTGPFDVGLDRDRPFTILDRLGDSCSRRGRGAKRGTTSRRMRAQSHAERSDILHKGFEARIAVFLR